jgi:hypothetical protein
MTFFVFGILFTYSAFRLKIDRAHYLEEFLRYLRQKIIIPNKHQQQKFKTIQPWIAATKLPPSSSPLQLSISKHSVLFHTILKIISVDNMSENTFSEVFEHFDACLKT